MDDEEELSSSFNKATIVRMPFLDTAEMKTLFETHTKYCNPAGVPNDIQDQTITASHGHPASFMILLNIFDDHRSETFGKWMSVQQLYIENYLNATHVKIKCILRKSSENEKSYIRELTSCVNGWNKDENIDKTEKDLLNFGVLTISNDGKKILFTSEIIRHVYINTLCPQKIKE